MPKYDLNELFDKAIESEDAEFAESMPVVPEEAPQEEVPAALSLENKACLFIMLMKKKLGCAKFHEIMTESATDLEVYELIPDAERLKLNENAYQEHQAQKRCGVLMSACLMLALNDKSDLGRSYQENEIAEQRILDAIYDQYNEQGSAAMKEMLEEDSRKSMTMSGPNAQDIQSAISQTLGEMGESV